MSKRGRVAMPLAVGWRAKRGSGPVAKGAFSDLCEYLDHCNAEDRAAGRPPMIDHLEAVGKYASKTNWKDR
jgi:hypothetical protein